MEAPSTDGPKQLPPCTEIQKTHDMGSFSYYWTALLSTAEHDQFYLHRRCWLYQMEYQNMADLHFFFTVTKNMSAWQAKKKQNMNDVVRPRQTGKGEQLHMCTCINPGDFIQDGAPKIWKKARPKKNVMFSPVGRILKKKYQSDNIL